MKKILLVLVLVLVSSCLFAYTPSWHYGSARTFGGFSFPCGKITGGLEADLLSLRAESASFFNIGIFSQWFSDSNKPFLGFLIRGTVPVRAFSAQMSIGLGTFFDDNPWGGRTELSIAYRVNDRMEAFVSLFGACKLEAIEDTMHIGMLIGAHF